MTSQILGLTLDWEFDNFDVKSISAWSNQDDISAVDDTDGTDITGVLTHRNGVLGALERSLAAGYGDFELPGDEKRNQYSQELQLSGAAFDDRLDYTTGIFLAREEIDDNVTGSLVGYNGYSYKADASTLIPQVSSATNSQFTNESYAIFAQGTYAVTDWYDLTLGLRYSTEKRKREASLYETDCEAIAADNLIPGAKRRSLPFPRTGTERSQWLLCKPAHICAHQNGGRVHHPGGRNHRCRQWRGRERPGLVEVDAYHYQCLHRTGSLSCRHRTGQHPALPNLQRGLQIRWI